MIQKVLLGGDRLQHVAGQRDKGASGIPLIRTLVSSQWLHSRDQSPPKGPTSEYQHLRGQVSTYGFLEGTLYPGFKITTDGDCSHEIKRQLLPGRKAMTNLDNEL